MQGSNEAIKTSAGGAVTLPAPQDSSARHEVAACPTCGSRSGSQVQSFVFALGSVDPRFPSSSVEKEYAQVVGRADSGGLANRELLYSILTRPENRYLPRQLCWVFRIERLDTYLLQPRDVNDFDKLVEAIRPPQNRNLADVDVVIGQRGPVAPPELCNGFRSRSLFSPLSILSIERHLCNESKSPTESRRGNLRRPRISCSSVLPRWLIMRGTPTSIAPELLCRAPTGNV